MRRFALFFLLFAWPCFGQSGVQILAGVPGISFNQYTFVADSGGTPIASVTSPSITLPSGAHVLVHCRNGSGTVIGNTISSSPSATWTTLTGQASGSIGMEQDGYALTIASGSTTFTCTPASSQGFQSMIVMVWTGGSGTADTNVAATGTTGTITSSSFSTAVASEIVFLCGISGDSPTWSAGSIGGSTGTLGGVSGATLGTGSDAGCAYRVTTSTIASGTGAISNTSGGAGVGTLSAFE